MAELIPVNVVIADRTYRLKISPEDEELVRKSAKLINEKIVEFRNNFAGKDMQDYVSMALFWFVTEQNRSGGAALLEQHSLKERLNMLEQIVDKSLS